MTKVKDVCYAIFATLLFVFVIALAMSTHPAYGAEVTNHSRPQTAQPKDSGNDAAVFLGFVAATFAIALYVDRQKRQKIALEIDRTPTSPVATLKFEQRF